MTVDLKIAEALGMRSMTFRESLRTEVFPHLVTDIYNVPHCIQKTPSNNGTPGFVWSLTGPDAGNTADVIKSLLAEQNYTIDERAVKLPDGVIYGCWIQRQPDIQGTEIHDIFEAHAKTAPLALRDALVKKFNLAKALGVEG